MIQSIIEKNIYLTIKQIKQLINDVPNSKYHNDKNLLEWINFANKVFIYWYLDGYNYVDIFATFIDKMKKLFYKSDEIKEINKALIYEVRKDVIKNIPE